MVKTRVHDLAAEFGIPSEQLLGMLREMNIFVRSHLSALEPDQVSAARVRWEREKRRSAEPEAPKKGRRRKTAAAEPAPAPVEAARPVRRRRTKAEVQQQEAEAQEQDERESAGAPAGEPFALEAPPSEPAAPTLSLEERARLLFKDLPATAEEAEAKRAAEAAAAPAEPEPAPAAEAPEPPAKPAAPETASAGGAPRKPFIPPRVPRPPAASPGAAGSPPRGPRPKPVFSSSAPVQPRTPPGGGRTFGPDAQPGGGRRKGGKRGRKNFVDQDAVQANIEKTLAGMKGGGGGRKRGRSDEPSYRDIIASRTAEEKEREKTRIRVNEFISVAELADLMKIPANQIVAFAFKELGLMVTVNQRLDFDQIELIASEFGFEALREEEYQADVTEVEVDAEEDLQPRSPVVTIMGHVDHGKTSLLDYVRKANIVAGEAGGITQHIGAYHVALPDGREITFLDTPGHQAFTAMRARGAQVTDLVVLVVAADDQVMPQTIEAISHAKNAGVPMVVAINKIDLPAANVAKVKQDLLQHSVVLEEFGGTVLHAPISAKSGQGVPELLEQVLLQAEVLELKANPDARAQGTVLEATLDPGKGPLATVLVQRGTLRVGDNFICGKFSGRVRALFDERGNNVKEAGPSIPVQILGFEGVPSAGDTFLSVADASEARDIAQKRQRLEREAQNRRSARGGTLEDLSRALKEGEVSQLPIIIKADQGGPAEALADALAQLGTDEVRVDVVLRGVGQITESDVLLAKASGAIIIGFHVRPDANARSAAEREGVDIRTYRIIYEAVEDVRNALEGLLKPEEKETVLGEAEVLELFKVSKVGTIAGCRVTSGTIQRAAKARVVREGVTVYTGEFGSLKRFKDDVKEVREGLECGIAIENFNDLKVGDRIESYRLEEIKRTLATSASESQE
ncbi:MAG TPA: translation initiation factor IF-2 [Gemmatimonadales bacterium]|nr:translation initiation factor IF-2 [Gemmatimonadales bacterium]HRX19114.1 translation initiation factor IF-2 [Gemmatimonadales bacterium]